MKQLFGVLLVLLAVLPPLSTTAQTDSSRYDLGNPALSEVWVDPINGNDENAGTSPDQALQTLRAAWNQIPMGEELTQGIQIHLLAGDYPIESVPTYWESRYGTFEAPIMIQAEPNTVTLPSLNIFDVRYLYFMGVTISSPDANSVFHCERCDHLLLRAVTIIGETPENGIQETVKMNQSQAIYIEDSDISGAGENALDFVAVQTGHIMGSRFYNAGDWCMYLKGGSAYFRIEGNEFFDCGTGGFTAGQGTGFEFMVEPWLHYEAYDIKFINNVVHDTVGAGVGVNGGYNILIAHNTFYRVGERSHILEVVWGLRSCDGDVEQCTAYQNAGGWGIPEIGGEEIIPNRNIYIYNNLFYNPAGYQSQWQHFTIFAPTSPHYPDSNLPDPVLADDNLQIRGNLIWNGNAAHPLGIEAEAGCQADNPTCNAAQLLAENAINTVEPVLVDPANGDFHLADGFSYPVLTIPDFTWEGLPTAIPQGDLSNAVNSEDIGAY